MEGTEMFSLGSRSEMASRWISNAERPRLSEWMAGKLKKAAEAIRGNDINALDQIRLAASLDDSRNHTLVAEPAWRSAQWRVRLKDDVEGQSNLFFVAYMLAQADQAPDELRTEATRFMLAAFPQLSRAKEKIQYEAIQNFRFAYEGGVFDGESRLAAEQSLIRVLKDVAALRRCHASTLAEDRIMAQVIDTAWRFCPQGEFRDVASEMLQTSLREAVAEKGKGVLKHTIALTRALGINPV